MVYPANSAPSAMGMRRSYKVGVTTKCRTASGLDNWIAERDCSWTRFPYRDRVDSTPPSRRRPEIEFTRRRLLSLAGTAGLAAAAATIAACEAPPGYRGTATSSASAVPASPVPSVTAAPSPVPAPTTVPSVTPVARTLLCRDAWRANPPRPGGEPNPLNRMTIHHTAATLGDNGNAPARLRQHQRYHQDTQGWIDIAYHVSVDRNGNLYELRNPEIVGDTATSYDPTGHFLVVCEGNFDEEEVTQQQLDGAALAFAWAASKWHIPTETLHGHRDASGDTACPGASLYKYVASGDLRNRVDALLATGPVELMKLCGPQAQQLVANIEAGM